MNHMMENGFRLIQAALRGQADRYGPHAARTYIGVLQRKLQQLEAKYMVEETEQNNTKDPV